MMALDELFQFQLVRLTMQLIAYLCNQLISLIACITHHCLGAASIGTGAKRFISFFIAQKMGLPFLNGTASLLPRTDFLQGFLGRISPIRLPFYAQWLP